MKDINADTAAAFAASEGKVACFVQFNFDSGVQRYSTLPYNVVWNDELWQGVGALADVSEIRETEALIATGIKITLAGLSPSIVQIALSENVQGRTAGVWFVALDDYNQPLDNTAPIEFEGKVDVPPIGIVEGRATITVNIESRLADFARPKVRRYTDADQQARYPGDRFFEFVPQMVEKELTWPNRQWFLK